MFIVKCFIHSLLILSRLLITPHCWRTGKLVAPCICYMCFCQSLWGFAVQDSDGSPWDAFCRNMKNTFRRNARSVTCDRQCSFCSWSGQEWRLDSCGCQEECSPFLACNSWRVSKRQSPCSSSRSDNRSCGAAAPA